MPVPLATHTTVLCVCVYQPVAREIYANIECKFIAETLSCRVTRSEYSRQLKGKQSGTSNERFEWIRIGIFCLIRLRSMPFAVRFTFLCEVSGNITTSLGRGHSSYSA